MQRNALSWRMIPKSEHEITLDDVDLDATAPVQFVDDDFRAEATDVDSRYFDYRPSPGSDFGIMENGEVAYKPPSELKKCYGVCFGDDVIYTSELPCGEFVSALPLLELLALETEDLLQSWFQNALKSLSENLKFHTSVPSFDVLLCFQSMLLAWAARDGLNGFVTHLIREHSLAHFGKLALQALCKGSCYYVSGPHRFQTMQTLLHHSFTSISLRNALELEVTFVPRNQCGDFLCLIVGLWGFACFLPVCVCLCLVVLFMFAV